MTENNVMEFCQWLMNEKGIEAGNLSDYINNNEEEVLKLAEEFKKPKFKIGGKIESAAEMFKCGGKTKKKKVKKGENGMQARKEQYKTTVDKDGRKVSLSVYPSFSNPLKVDSMISVPAPQGGMYTLFSRYNEPKSGSRQDEMGNFDKLDPETAARLFRKNANLFNGAKKFDDGGPIGEDGIYREYIKFGPEYGRFEDHTGKYERIITPKQDTIWRFNDYGSERSAYTTPIGLEGTITTVYGDVNKMSPEELKIARNSVESRMKNIPYKKYLLEKYGDEMLMPENKEKKQDGGELFSRKDLRKEAKENYGFNNKQFRDAYRNSIAAYQNKGYKRSKAKEFAQDILTRAQEKPQVTSPVLTDIGSPVNKILTVPADINMPINKFSTVIAGGFSNISDYDSMSFNSAFASARKSGAKTFWWRGKEYGTELKNNSLTDRMLAQSASDKVNSIANNKKMIIPKIEYAEYDPMDLSIVPVRRNNPNPIIAIPSLGDNGHMIEDVVITAPNRDASNTKVNIPVISGIPRRFGLYRGFKKGGKIK